VRAIGRTNTVSGDKGEPLEADSALCVHPLIDMAIIQGTTSSSEAAWLPGVFVRDSLSSSILGKHLSVPSLVLDDQCPTQFVRDGDSVSDQNLALHGLEMVPFEEGEPVPLNWNQSMVVEGRGG
jgi:hypothetical protein